MDLLNQIQLNICIYDEFWQNKHKPGEMQVRHEDMIVKDFTRECFMKDDLSHDLFIIYNFCWPAAHESLEYKCKYIHKLTPSY